MTSFSLYPYQEKLKKKIIKKLKKYSLVYLAAGERVGKTLTTLSALQDLDVKNVLFITIKPAIKGIQKDYSFGKFSFDITIINYESLEKVAPYNDFDAIVFDESTKLAAFPKPSLNIKRAYKAVKEADPDYIIYLNATPSVESYAQLFHQFHISNKVWSKYRNFYAWFKDYGIPYERRVASGRIVKVYDRVKKKRMLKEVSKYMISVTRKDAGFSFDEAIINEHEIKLPKDILKIYNELKANGIYKIDNTHIVADSVTKVMMKLQQITGGFIYTDEGKAIPLHTVKADYIKERAKGSKIAIYAKYTYEVELLKSIFNAQTDPFTFKEDNSRFLVMQIKTGSKGIDLSFCDQHWFYSLDFSGETFIQAIARQHNKKRSKPVEVEVVHTGLIDREVFKAVKNKKKFNTQLYRRLND